MTWSVRNTIFNLIQMLLLSLLPLGAIAQDTCVFLFTIPQNARFATADHLANTYVLQGFELEKHDSTGRLVTRYTNNRLGMPAFLDATNPLKLLLWYADFQTAVFLDRNLTELGSLNLTLLGLPAVRVVATAADGNLWVYDEASAQLLKLSSAGERLLESQPLNLEFPQRFSPTCVRDDGGQAVLLSDPAQGLAVFNPFSQLDKILLIKNLARFEVENGVLYYLEEEGIRIESWRGLSSRSIPFPPPGQVEGSTFWLSKRRLFRRVSGGLEVFGF